MGDKTQKQGGQSNNDDRSQLYTHIHMYFLTHQEQRVPLGKFSSSEKEAPNFISTFSVLRKNRIAYHVFQTVGYNIVDCENHLK